MLYDFEKSALDMIGLALFQLTESKGFPNLKRKGSNALKKQFPCIKNVTRGSPDEQGF